MEKPYFRKILIFVCAFGTIILIPQMFNIIISWLSRSFNVCIPLRFDLDNWYNIMAIAFPSALTYTVIKQSEQQQQENADLQKQMEKISIKMLELELKSGLGYLRPYFSVKDAGAAGTHRQRYPYELDKHINLINSGDDDVFVVSAKFSANGNQYVIPGRGPLFISKQTPYNEYLLETSCLTNELNATGIDMEIELVLRTIKGFQYKEVLFLRFINKDKVWNIDKFNLEIQEVE